MLGFESVVSVLILVGNSCLFAVMSMAFLRFVKTQKH